MSQEPCKIELFSNGDGYVAMFVNGKYVGEFYTEYDMSSKLVKKLSGYVVKYDEPSEYD